MAEKTKKNRKSQVWEIIWLVLFGIIWVAGLVIGILGICAHNVGWLLTNPLYAAETSMTQWLNWGFRVDWRIFGAILLVIGTIGLVITLFYFANKHDKEAIKAARRAERLKAILASEANPSEAVVSGFTKSENITTDKTSNRSN